MTNVRDAAMVSKAWPYEEARKVLKRYPQGKTSGPVIFETGYGPSGLPHIGTFNEVLRTTMVRHAFETLSDMPTTLIAFSDDMDGLRKVPDNVPNQEMLKTHLGKPLTRIPDPFGKFESFAHHNNAMLREFLDRFGFEYDFVSSTERYTSGAFDEALKNVLRHYQAIMDIMIPTLRKERAATYSPVLPISAKTGIVLQVPVEVVDADAGLVRFEDEGETVTQSILGGQAKLQWKVDWAMRWVALGVDYEMYGKDLTDSGVQSGRIAQVLGGRKPEGLIYEMFLDEKGEKISKSKGNGISVEEWLRYAPPESLSLYNFQKPKTAKRLYFDVIPKAVDEYLTFLDAYPGQNAAERLENPVWHIHAGGPPAPEAVARYAPATNEAASAPISFALLLNLVSAADAATKDQLWRFIAKYAPGASPTSHPRLDNLCGYAIAYYDSFVKPAKRFRLPTDKERAAIMDLIARFEALPADATDGELIQTEVYAVGKECGFEPLRDWFKALYEVLLGQEQGPRFGSFAAIFGLPETIALMRRALAGELAKAA